MGLLALLGPGNPSFEKRLIFTPGVSGEPYWSASSGGWRDVKGDVNSDKICDSSDLYAVANAYGSQPCDPNWDSDCDLNGDRIVDISDLYTVGLDYGKEVNCKDGSYSWYTSGSGGYNMTQWLCNNDVNYLKGKEATFSFWFKQHETGNNAMAKITYVTETGQQTISGSPVYATEGWHNTTVTTTLPANTVAIKVIINLTDDHATWIDKATIETS